MDFAPVERVDDFLLKCEIRMKSFISMSRAVPSLPSAREEIEVAISIKNHADSLSNKLETCGGAWAGFQDSLINCVQIHGEYSTDADVYLGDLRRRMRELSAVAESMLEATRKEIHEKTRYDTQQQLAANIAEAYFCAIGVMPKGSVQRDYEKAHPYVQVLHVVYDFATGKNHELSTIEHIARKAFD